MLVDTESGEDAGAVLAVQSGVERAVLVTVHHLQKNTHTSGIP